jgi:3-oxoacyl-[acyl-carrier-protein] synthase-3
LERLVETSDEWIVSRTGMRERRIAHESEFPSDMAAQAATRALQKAKISPDEIDLILVATMSPDYITPSTAVLLQRLIGAKNAAAFDIQAACSGFLYALSMAKAYIESGLYRTALVVATEKMSAFMDYTDRNTCVLFGDGAGAVVVTAKGVGLAIDSVHLGADGEMAELIIVPGGAARHPTSAETLSNKLHYFQMAGKEVFRHAVRRMVSAAQTCLESLNLSDKDISWLVPHQANIRIIEAIRKSFEIPDERVFKTIHKYGNTSASSVPIALDELIRAHRLKAGEHILLTAFGGGLTWGASILTKVQK